MAIKKINVFAFILNYNSASESVELFSLLNGFNLKYLKILVIDNNSFEIDKQELKDHIPAENLIFNKKNFGYSGGNNIGIALALKAKADYVWILNPDIRVNDQTLPILLKTIVADKTLAAVGPRIMHRNAPEKIFSDGEILKMDKKCSTQHKNHNLKGSEIKGKVDYDIDYIAGSSILMNCEAIKKIGKFPEEYFLYFEETDWCFKANKNEWKLAINSKAQVYNLTSIKTSVFHYYFMRNRLLFSKKYHPNFKKVRIYYIIGLLREVAYRFRGEYFKPFFISRVKGLISGIINTSINK